MNYDLLKQYKLQADEDMDRLQDELKTCKAENERMLTLITRLTAEGKSRESVQQEALLLQNQLQAERLRYQKMRDSFHKLQTSTENVMKEAAQAAVSDDRLTGMGEVHLLENQYKSQKLENEKLWRLISSLKSDTEKLRTVLPHNISEVSVTICEQDNISEEMKNVCTRLIAAKEGNKRLQDIVDNLRRDIDTLQCKLTETSIENDNLTMQNQRRSSENEEVKVQADDLSSRLSKFVTEYPKQMPDTASIRAPTKEVRCHREKLVVNVTTCNIASIKEENLRLENLLKERETEIATMREVLSAKGIQVPAHMEVPIDVIKESKKTDEDTYEDTSTKKLLSHLAAENELLKKHLERRSTYTPEIIIQLEEENELLKKQLSSETQIMESGQKETIRYMSKPTEEIKASQQWTIETKGVTDATRQHRRTSFAGKVTEKALRKVIDSLQKQLYDANSIASSLETALDELRNARSSLQVTGFTGVAPPKGRCGRCGKSVVRPENETILTRIPAAAQQSRAKSIAETENERIMRNRIESLQRQLSDANRIVRSLQEATSTPESENERNLHNKIEGLQSQLSDANNMAISVEKTFDEVHNEYQSLQATGVTELAQQPPGSSTAERDNERSLRNQVESLRKQLSDANNMVISLERTLDELRYEHISMQVAGVTEVPRWGRGVSGAESENERLLREQIESLQKQLTDAKGTVTRATIKAETEKERMLQNQIEILQNQLTDANNRARDLESTLDELRDEYESMQVAGNTEVARQSRGAFVAESEILRKRIESLQKQLTDANNAVSTLTSEATTAETENERLLQIEIEIIQNQLTGANNMVRGLESTLDELKKENESLKVSGITEVAQVNDRMPTTVTDSERITRNEIESLQKQLTDANGMVKSLETTVTELRKQIESWQKKLIKSNAMVQELEDRVKKLTDENNILKSKPIKDDVAKENVPQDLGVSAPSTIDPKIEKVMKQLKTDNQSLRNQLEEARKSVHKTSDDESEYEKIINELKTENQQLQKKIEEIRLKQPRWSLEDTGTTKIINQMTQENELLKTQVEDLKMSRARPSSAGPSRDIAFEQLTKNNEVLRERLENARKSLPVTSVPQEAIEKLRTDNEILRKQLKDARKMAQSSQEQILVDDYTKIIDQVRDENEFLKKRLESLTDITSVSAKEVVKIVEKPIEIIKADTDSEKTINELRNLNESLKNELKDAKTVRQELEEQIRKLKDEKQRESEKITTTDEKAIDEDISQLTEQNELLKKQLTDVTNTIEDPTQNIAKLKDEIQKLPSTKVSDVPSGAEEHSKELQKLQAELEALRDENNRLHRDNDRLTLELETLTEDKVPSDLALWKAEEKQLESVVDEQKRRLTSLISKMSKIEHPGKVAAWKKEREHLLDMIKQLTKEVQEGKDALKEKEETNAVIKKIYMK